MNLPNSTGRMYRWFSYGPFALGIFSPPRRENQEGKTANEVTYRRNELTSLASLSFLQPSPSLLPGSFTFSSHDPGSSSSPPTRSSHSLRSRQNALPGIHRASRDVELLLFRLPSRNVHLGRRHLPLGLHDSSRTRIPKLTVALLPEAGLLPPRKLGAGRRGQWEEEGGDGGWVDRLGGFFVSAVGDLVSESSSCQVEEARSTM